MHMGILKSVVALTNYPESVGSLKQIKGQGELKIKDREWFRNYI